MLVDINVACHFLGSLISAECDPGRQLQYLLLINFQPPLMVLILLGELEWKDAFVNMHYILHLVSLFIFIVYIKYNFIGLLNYLYR